MIYLVRHAEPAAGWGHHDNPGLSDHGKGQAEAVAIKLKNMGATKAVTSPMARCVETAKPFERLIETHARIEARVGEIQTPPDVGDRVTWLRSAMSGKWEEMGEGYTSWRSNALDAVAQMPQGTAVFSHYVAINAIVSLIDRDDRVHVFSPGHCSITVIDIKGREFHVSERGEETALSPL